MALVGRPDDIIIVDITLLIGGVGGILVGIAGMGSTLVVLPTLIFLFSFLFHSTGSLKMAVGTTLACGMTAAAANAYHYIKQGNAKLAVVIRVAPVYFVTAIIGPSLVHYMPVALLHLLVGVVLILMSGIIAFSNKLSLDSSQKDMSIVELLLMALMAGMVTSMSGVATGVILIPYLCRYLPRLQAIGTSVTCAVIGCGIATISYIVSGLNQSSVVLPPYSFGYVYLPAYGLLAVGVVVFSPLGVRLSKRINVKGFKILLAALLCSSGLYSIYIIL